MREREKYLDNEGDNIDRGITKKTRGLLGKIISCLIKYYAVKTYGGVEV